MLFVGLFVCAVLIYRNGLHIPYYADDYQRVFTNPGEALSQSFSEANFYDHSYRPLETAVLAFVQINWDWDTLPFRLINILLHAAGALLVFHALRFWKINIWCAYGAALFVIVSQLSAAAVLGNDTQSQITGSLFSALSLWLLYRYKVQSKNTYWRYALSVLVFFLALISKETSSGLSLAIAFLAFAIQPKQNFSLRLKRASLIVLPYALCGIVYWILRMNAGSASPSFGDEHLSLRLGMNIPMNIGLFFFQSILPVSSMTLMKALHYKEWLMLTGILFFTAIFIAVIGYGIRKSSHKSLVKGLCIIIICSWIPAILLNHIGELYAYNSIFYIAVIFAIGAEYYIKMFVLRSKQIFVAAILLLIAVGISNSIGVNEKASSMKIQGDRAAIFLPQIISFAKKMPSHQWMYLVSPKDTSFEYSMFAIHGFRVSGLSDSLVRFFSERPDVRVYPGDSSECAQVAKQFSGVAFTYDPLTLHIYPMRSNFTGR